MKRNSLLLAILATWAIEGCQPSFKTDCVKVDTMVKTAFRGALENPIVPVGKDYLAFYHIDTMYLIRPKLKPAEKESVQIEYSLQEGSIRTNKVDFVNFGAPISIGQKGLLLGKLPLDSIEARGLKRMTLSTGEGRNTSQGVMNVDFGLLFKIGYQSCEMGLADWQKEVYKAVFEQQLRTGQFAEFPHGFYLLFSDKACWVITSANRNNKADFMLHFTKKEGGFDNYSFSLLGPSLDNCSVQYEGISIHRINMEQDVAEYLRVRIGQYDSEGNLWAQEYRMEHLLANPLLRYQGDLRGIPGSSNQKIVCQNDAQ